MPPEFRRHDDQTQGSSSPPPPYMPPGRRRHDDQPHRSSSPLLPYMPPGRRRHDDQPQRSSSSPPPPYMPPGRRRDDQPQRSSSPPPPYIPPGRRRRDDQLQRSSPPRMPPEHHRRDQRYSWFPYHLPDGQQILAYKDRKGVLFTDHGGPTRPVADVCRSVDESDTKRSEEDQQTTTPNPGPSSAQFTGEDQQMTTPIPGTFQVQYAEQDQPTPQQTPTLNPGPSSAQYLDDLLNKAFVFHKLEMAQRGEVQDPLALKLHRALLSSSFVSSLAPTGLFIKYFVRVDKAGFYHIYPDRGGPFKNLQEAQEAIDSHHVEQRKIMCMDGLPDEERAVRNSLYWFHDGTRKHSAEALASITTRRPTRELLMALLDRHNEDNHLLGDHAYELKDIVRHNSCFDEGEDCIYRSYSHFNLTMKTKGTKDLYFAEVTCISGDYEAYVLTCICMVKPDHNGECLVCEVEMKDMKHPTDGVYNHGRCPPPPMLPVRSRRSKAYGVALFEQLYAVHDEDWLIEEEARVRRILKEGKEARRSKLEVDRGDDMIKEEKATRCKLEVDKMVASRKLELDNFLNKLRARSGRPIYPTI